MKNKLLIFLSLATFSAFGQKKYEVKLGVGNTNMLTEYANYDYSQIQPNVSLSVAYGITASTYLGLFVQNEWHKRDLKGTYNFTDNSGNPIRSYKVENSLSYITIGLKGVTYFASSPFYGTYSYGYMVNYKSKTEYPNLTVDTKKINTHAISLGMGAVLSRKWKISPFIEVSPTLFLVPSNSVFGVQSKIGIRF